MCNFANKKRMRHLFFVLASLSSLLEMAAYNPYDNNIHTVGKFVYEVDINADKETGFATLIDVKPNTELKGEITIPGSITIDGTRYVVNHIGDVYPSSRFFECDRAFKDFPEITRVNIPSTITDIGYMEFLGCTGINEFHVNANNVNFKDEDGILFHRWDENSSWRLFRMPPARPKTKYTLPNDVKRIEQCAFADNKTIRSIILPTDFIFDDPLWAWGNKSIKEIDVTKTTYYTSQGGIIFEKWGEGRELVACPPGLKLDSYSVPNDCHTIAAGAFCFSSIPKIKLNGSLKDLKAYAFAGSNIEELEVNADLLSSYRNIYGLCVNAKKLKKIHAVGENTACFDRFAFAMCTALTEVIIDNSVELKTGAMYGCSALKEFPFHLMYSMEGAQSQITYSGEGRQFQGSGLESVEFPSHLYMVPEYCFNNCPDLKDVSFNQNGGSTEVIDFGAFKNCASLESINLCGINDVRGGAFAGTPIKKIIVPSRDENEENLKVGLSFDFQPETKWYIDSPCVKYVSADGSNNMTTSTFIVSSFQNKRTVPNHWKQLYCPPGMKDYYENLYENHNWGGPVTELFYMAKMETLPYVIIEPNPSLSEISLEITGVTLNGLEAELDGDGRWFHPEIKSLSGVIVQVNYNVDDVPMSTTFPEDFTTHVNNVAVHPQVITGIYDTSGRYVGTQMETLTSGIYIVTYSDNSTKKIVMK